MMSNSEEAVPWCGSGNAHQSNNDNNVPGNAIEPHTEGNSQSEKELDDSIVFVDEYIDLEAPTRSPNIAIKTEHLPSEQPINNEVQQSTAAIAENVFKMEKTQEEQNDAGSSDELEDMKPVPSAILMPVAIKEEEANNEAAPFDESKQIVFRLSLYFNIIRMQVICFFVFFLFADYFGDASTASSDFQSPDDRTDELIRLYAGRAAMARESVTKKLQF